MKHLIKIFLFISTLSFSQDMTKGFEMLEKGNFNEAEQFFTVILNDFPTNKTAKICYARALGLSSNPNEALILFKSLQETYPNDLEIDLNYAEALLWNKKFDEAKIFYDDLVKKNPDNFG
jgi:tetratricopeptide (TPR) repeat protein